MATINFPVTYPDGEAARLMGVLKAQYTVNGVVPTNAQAIELLRQHVARMVRSFVLDAERAQARAAAIEANRAAGSVTEIDLT